MRGLPREIPTYHLKMRKNKDAVKYFNRDGDDLMGKTSDRATHGLMTDDKDGVFFCCCWIE